eukprot:TRINITY_DN7453_c0_g2_i2.p1 TRINITY_DN7453_c0_g2~~TRINITY_DN7453_c0_g2_i2.p1  ORF type:complete len:730 (+),score=158.80 TRINITY_DN7453_c0_g2_i2:131-2191(+)
MQDVGGVFDPNLKGACRPCALSKACARVLRTTPICDTVRGSCNRCTTNIECSQIGIGFANCQADGSCKSCLSNADCGTDDGGEKSGQTVCDTTTGLCGDPFRCMSNPSCVGRGGSNCQKTQQCINCRSNSDCGSLDGGEVTDQSVCDLGTGLCGSCSTNLQCLGAMGNNCQLSGMCKTCISNSDCGSLDGGEVPGQSICNVLSGICEGPCSRNQDCSSKTGKNCQSDGTCFSCRTDSDCGALDGGETPGQSQCIPELGLCTTPFTCTTNPSCIPHGGGNCQKNLACVICTGTETCGVNDGGTVPNQPNCNLLIGTCIDSCRTNLDCSQTQGSNCQASGVCQSCNTNGDCGVNDGGEVTLQPICNPSTGYCESACTTNLDCSHNQGKNCQKDGSCVSCVTSSNCGIFDGGESPNQLECNVATGLCQDPFKCLDNPSCVGRGGANCQADKSCKNCLSSADCGVLDGGEVPRQPICNTTTGLCGYCKSDRDCPKDNPNCGADGTCYACNNKTSGKGCGALDGPPGGPGNNQPYCDELMGLCVDGCTMDSHCTTDPCSPYCDVERHCCVECYSNKHCPHSTWRPDQFSRTTCSTLTNQCVEGCVVDEDCPNQNASACAVALGMCVECVYNIHCGIEKPYCHPTNLVCTDVNGWNNHGLSNGEIAGIIVACVMGVVLIILLTLFLASAMLR